MLATLSLLPPDPILGTVAQFRADSASKKIDLSIGVFRNKDGITPVPTAIQTAARRAAADNDSKAYMGATGYEQFNERIARLVLGPSHPALIAGRVATIQTTGGTAALRLAGDLIDTAKPGTSLAIGEPSWSNHGHIFLDAGLSLVSYSYYSTTTSHVTWNDSMRAIRALPKRSALLLHGCCHNPTGEDLSPERWREIAAICREHKLLPIVDLAYQGLADSLDEDAYGVRLLAAELPELLIAVSCSKNFGLYRDRTGALMAIGGTTADAAAARSHAISDARAIYSMPPHHGADLVVRVLSEPALDRAWLEELGSMRAQLLGQRQLLADALRAASGDTRYAFLVRQRGLFSQLDLTSVQIERLISDFHVYLAPGGRINIAGVRSDNVEYLASAIVKTAAEHGAR